MTNIDELMEMWSKDCKIDETAIDSELIRIPILHSRYLNIMTHNSMICKRLSFTYAEKKNFKHEYYDGHYNNPDDLQKYNIEPFVKKVYKTDMARTLEADKELNEILMKKAIHQEIVDFCEAVLKELHSRTFQLRSLIDYRKYMRGE